MVCGKICPGLKLSNKLFVFNEMISHLIKKPNITNKQKILQIECSLYYYPVQNLILEFVNRTNFNLNFVNHIFLYLYFCYPVPIFEYSNAC